ncbi:uncharacterized protein LOC128987248 [Macrosteles quadrilineatus]|uniref:uncharacterized protein LOC128987248 n=1 Tax=Macrosteles quadrilineatus TaxID=74068 RepID=UPI0023E29B1C|nr:uncharacterized protein LOC128987248 [Macrosteles quadrilineatus]
MTDTVLEMDANRSKDGITINDVASCILDKGGDVPLDLKQVFLLPAWYNEEKFRRGQKYFYDNYFSLFVSKLSGLLVVLAVPSILKVLVLTGQSSHPLSAFRRYLDTISHMLEWYDGDLTNPNSRASKSLLGVRGRHCHATRRASKAGYGQISQRDMALTQFGFMGFALLRSKELGLSGSDADLEGFVHFWRTIGYLLGIKDKYNLCQGDVQTTRQTCQAMLDKVFVVGLKQNSTDFQMMSKALLEGMWAVIPFINTEAFFGFTKMLCGVDDVQFTNVYSKTLFNLQVFVHNAILNSFLAAIIRPILNFNMWLALFITQRFPYLAFLAFGREITAPEQYTIKSSLATEQCTGT